MDLNLHISRRDTSTNEVEEDWLLKRPALLRTIHSAIYDDVEVTEAILEALESLEAFDRGQGIRATPAMKAAYCAVATECTVKFLICFGRKYVDAVDRIWRGRVRVLEESEKSELVTAELKERRAEVEKAIWDMSVSKKLDMMNTRNEAVMLLADYVKEAWAVVNVNVNELGDLDYVSDVTQVEAVRGNGASVGADRFDWEECRVDSDANVGDVIKETLGDGNVGDMANGNELEINGANVGDECKPEEQMEMESDTKACNGSKLVILTGVELNSGSALEVPLTNGDLSDGGEKKESKANHIDGSGVMVPRANGADFGADRYKPHANASGVTVAISKFGSLLGYYAMDGVLQVVGPGRSQRNVNRSALNFEPAKKDKEVGRKVAEEEHKSSVTDLQAIHTVPLPYALPMPEFVRSELDVSGEDGIENPPVVMTSKPDDSRSDSRRNVASCDKNNVPESSGKETNAPNMYVEEGKSTKYVRSGDINPGVLCFSNQNSSLRLGLMERNSTAHTIEWDESLGMSPEGTSNSKGRFHLPTAEQNAISPLKKCDRKRISMRRKVKKWSAHEEDTLKFGVQEYGKGNWKLILDTNTNVFDERTEVDLKDKWRNMSKQMHL